MVRRWFYQTAAGLLSIIALLSLVTPNALWSLVVIAPLIAIGLYDALQKRHTVLRNFPLIGRIRYFLEMIRPEIQQYFIEGDIDQHPISREFRNIAYQRAKKELETRPFGTQRDVYDPGYEWASHSMTARAPVDCSPRVQIGGPDCRQPYSASILNISAMSFGALSSSAILALNGGAKLGNFAHNTGEGGLSRYHLEPGGDLIWQVGTGYFGCRTKDGNFDAKRFRDNAQLPAVKMIELKLSQGAKPGHGGVLPGAKVSVEIAAARGVTASETVLSPPAHSAFSSPQEMLEFIGQLRDLADGKPVGFKLCLGRIEEFFAICKAMLSTGITPDFITVDGGEGGTGAAPLEFTNSMGTPGRDGWAFVHSALTGAGVRDRIKLIASGKIITGFHMIRAFALGADLCASARGMMLALGCIQSLRCNTNRCPTGITTQDPALTYGLDIADKRVRVANFHAGTVRGCMELVGAMGKNSVDQIEPRHIHRRTRDLQITNFEELYRFMHPGQLLDEHTVPERFQKRWQSARVDQW